MPTPRPIIPISQKKYICRHCKVEVNSSYDKRAVPLKEHKKNCPRRRVLG